MEKVSVTEINLKIVHPVFVILPLQDENHIKRVFTDGIKPALKRFGFDARRVDDQAVKEGIVEAIRQEIKEAYFLIADLSFARPNCYYEVGLAHELGKPVLLIKDDKTSSHFDLGHLMIHEFKADNDLVARMEDLIPKFLVTERREREDTQNGKFGRQCIRDGFRLAAEIDECSDEGCWLNFEVCSVKPEVKLEGVIKFYMHDSYEKTVQTMTAKSGRVWKSEVESSDGPWTLGAEVVATGTKLELDLSTLPGAEKWWYKRAIKRRA